jgi:outer membrane lipoprotein-sorting protein
VIRSRYTFIAMLLAMVSATAPAQSMAGGPAGAPDPYSALRSADSALYPESYTMTVAIDTQRPGKEGTRLTLAVSHKAGKGTFMEILSPARSKDTRFLITAADLWMFSPRAGSRSPLRLSPRESFQGSAFSNNDIGESSWAEDYSATVTGSSVIDAPGLGSVETWIVEGKALRKNVSYGAMRLWVRKADLLPLRVEYDAKSGLHVKTMVLTDFAVNEGRLRPSKVLMTEEGAGGSQSTVTISDLVSRKDLPDTMFNQSWLVR